MKFILFLVFIFSAISCNNSNMENFQLDSGIFISGIEHKAVLNKFDDNRKYFLQIHKYTDSEQHVKYEVVEFILNNNNLEANFKFDSSDYTAIFSVSDSFQILEEYPQKIKYIYNPDSSLKSMTYYNLLFNSNTDNYLDIFNKSLIEYPDNIGIYLLRWQFEGSNNLAKKDSLINHITVLENKHSNNPDIHFVLSIAYKLLDNKDKYTYELNQLMETPCKLFNNEFTANIFNTVYSTGIQQNFDKNELEPVLREILLANPTSFFAVRSLSSPYKSKYDSLNVPILYDILNKGGSHYTTILDKLYSTLVFNFMPDSIETINLIENEFKNMHNNKFQLYFSGKNPYFVTLPNKQIFNEIRYHKNHKMGYYNNAIRICREKIGQYLDEDNISLTKEQYLRIANIYENDLQLYDSAISNYLMAYSVKDKESKLKKELLRIYNKNYENVSNFENWSDSVKKVIDKQNRVRNSKLSENSYMLKYSNGKEINLNYPKKNVVLIFYSINCSPCKWIFRSIKDNIEKVKNSDIEFIYVSKDKLKDIELMEKEYHIGFKHIVNNADVFTKYGVKSVPIILSISYEGNILDKLDGANNEFNVADLISNFDN